MNTTNPSKKKNVYHIDYLLQINAKPDNDRIGFILHWPYQRVIISQQSIIQSLFVITRMNSSENE